MEINLLLKKFKEMLPEQVDYAEMVGAPSFAYGEKYCYEDEWGYICEDAIEKLEKLAQYEYLEEQGKLIKLPCSERLEFDKMQEAILKISLEKGFEWIAKDGNEDEDICFFRQKPSLHETKVFQSSDEYVNVKYLFEDSSLTHENSPYSLVKHFESEV